MIQSAIILTHGDMGYPHMESLMASNPSLRPHVAHSPETGEPKHELWKNSDRFLVDWWRANRDQVAGDVVAVMEWDTLVTIPLPEMPDGIDLAARMCGARFVVRGAPVVSDGFTEWQFSPPAGLHSFGFFLCWRGVLDSVAKPEWDYSREISIRNETRFPSIALAEGARLGRIHLPFVTCKKPMPVLAAGIYHPCKP